MRWVSRSPNSPPRRASTPSDVIADLLDAMALTRAWSGAARQTLGEPVPPEPFGTRTSSSEPAMAAPTRTGTMGQNGRPTSSARGCAIASSSTLEEGVRTHHERAGSDLRPANRGVLAPGYAADMMLLDLEQLQLGDKYLVTTCLQVASGGVQRWKESRWCLLTAAPSSSKTNLPANSPASFCADAATSEEQCGTSDRACRPVQLPSPTQRRGTTGRGATSRRSHAGRKPLYRRTLPSITRFSLSTSRGSDDSPRPAWMRT